MREKIEKKITEEMGSCASSRNKSNRNGREEYAFPLLVLLNPEEKGDWKHVNKEEIRTQCSALEKTLADFGVKAKITGVTNGPSVTRFELEPASGVKVSSVANLADDIALRLAVPGVRMEIPVPGKALIGLEVPAIKRYSVSFRKIVDCDEVRNNPSGLCVGLGVDMEGNVIKMDLTGMSHLLAAGMYASDITGFLDTLLAGVFYKARPEEVKIILIDNKARRFIKYNGVPHLLGPVITDTKDAVSALQWAVKEMKIRCHTFADKGVSDIRAYNAIVAEKMPYIMIVVSELYSLMAKALTDTEDIIYSLSQIAPVCGIHMVLATQTAGTVTEVVKMSIPSRIAFALSSLKDSRTVLYKGGAEKLMGKGDMLFYPAGATNPLRVQGAFISDGELNRVTDYIKRQAVPGTDNPEVTNTALTCGDRKEEMTVVPEVGKVQEESNQDELLEEEKDVCDSCTDIPPAKIIAVGVGCGGICCINSMVSCGVQGVEFLAVDCDAQVLRSSVVQNRIQIGKQLTEGLGAGSRPEVGWIAAEMSRDEMLERLSGADIVFVVAGMGGGAGSGAAPVVAECARETGALTVGFVARPFNFEGSRRMSQADRGILKMKKHVDALITISNDQLLWTTETKESSPLLFHSAFADALRLGIQGITDIIAAPGLLNADVNDVKRIFAGVETVSMGIGTARGDDARTRATNRALRKASVEGARSVLFNITGGKDLSLYAASRAADMIVQGVEPDASVVFGVIIDDKMADDEVRVSCYFVH